MVDTCWMGTRKPTGWRALAGASPYAVRATDDEFLAEIQEGTSSRYYLIPIPRVLLGAASRRFLAGENQFAGSTRMGVDASLAGNQLTIAVFEVGDAANNSTLNRVIAR